MVICPGFPGGSVLKESACNTGDTGDTGSIPGLGRSTGEEHGNPLQYSYLENSMDWGTWWGTVHRVAKSQTQLNDLTQHSIAHFSSFQSSGLLSSKYVSLPLFFFLPVGLSRIHTSFFSYYVQIFYPHTVFHWNTLMCLFLLNYKLLGGLFPDASCHQEDENQKHQWWKPQSQ